MTCICDLCGSSVSLSNITRHRNSKNCQAGSKYVPNSSKNCKFCNKLFDTSVGRGLHEIQCELNPIRKIPNLGKTAWNKGQTKETNSTIATAAAKLKNTLKDKDPVGCCAWSKEKRSLEAKKRNFGGYRENAGRSQKYKVVDSYGKETTLQSSYELRCSIILNELGIKWVRPKALKYDNKNYFADFYLPDHDIYLDPKNNYKAKQDREKINKVVEQNKVKVFVLLDKQLTHEFIGRII